MTNENELISYSEEEYPQIIYPDSPSGLTVVKDQVSIVQSYNPTNKANNYEWHEYSSLTNARPEYIISFDYRGLHGDIFYDDAGQSFYATWDTREKPISLGTYNTEYKETVQFMIDCEIDTIWSGNGAILEWFDNNGHSDIRLRYHGCMVKFWLVADPNQVNLETITTEAKEILQKNTELFKRIL